MFQLSLTVLLALSISANFVFMIEVFEADTANLQNESPVGVLKNNNQMKESSKLHEEPSKNVTKINSTPEKDQQKVDTSQAKSSTVTPLTSQNITTTLSIQNVTRPIEETTPMIKKEVVTQKPKKLSDEQANINPSDENKKDVVTIETPKENSMSSGTTPSLIDNTTTPDNSSSQPVFYPLQNIGKESSNLTGSLNGSMYNTFPPDLDNVTEAITSKISKSTVVTTIATNTTNPAAVITKTTPTTVTTPTTPTTVTTPTTPTTVTTKATPTAPTTVTTKATPTTVTTKTTPAVVNTTTTIINTTGAINANTESKNNQTKNGNDRSTVEEVANLQQAELSEKGKESNNGSKDGSMPPGIIALVTAITFAVAIAIGYISMVVWKQYLEHRYGRRELLVNELEFDTNDLRHFEL